MPRQPVKKAPDLTSVRTLVTSVAPLARHLKLTSNAIYRWFKVNRIPGEHIIQVANFYDVELKDLINLTGSEKSEVSPYLLKPRSVLPTLLEVRAGTLTLAEAVERTGQPERSLHLIMVHWGEELRNLYETLEALDKKEITLDEAGQRLGVAKYTVHGMRRKYGYAPGVLPRTRPEKTIDKRRAILRKACLEVIAGKGSAEKIAAENNISARNLFRFLETMGARPLSEISHFPPTFRRAYADEIDKNLPKYVEKWLEIADKTNLFIKKRVRFPATPKSWKDVPLKRMLVGVLTGEGTLESIAAKRGADPTILAGLFTSDLQAMGLTFEEVQGMNFNHQTALTELLIWQLDRKRRFKND